MMELRVGQRVKVRPKIGTPQEGIVYTTDPSTNTITIKKDISKSVSYSTVFIFNLSHVDVDVVGGTDMVDDPMTLPNISDRELQRKEEKMLADATKAWAQINAGASVEGQAIFDLFSKTLDCEWSGKSIVILGSVRIDPPYNVKDCRSLDEDETGMERVILMVLMRCPEVTLAFSPEEPLGPGSLTVTNLRVVWLSSEEPSKACDFDVPYICLHAISKDPATFPSPCIYCQLAEEEEDVLKEAFFAPADAEVLPALFDGFSRAAEMHPEPGEGDDDDGVYVGGGGIMLDSGSELTAEQARVMAHLDSVLVVPEGMETTEDGQFEDAEDNGDADGLGGRDEGRANGHANGGAQPGANGSSPPAPSS